ncbi:XrtA/PEP-CTERM system histidine kinase PrsK [Rheinheimera baltica]|uniref:XrtA/PEP-CTERM system histidine kinase PrsK n=1 Tax=Rheinheimera baltica TaxID=67576 RepID=UPI00273E705A|nr:XrtA/PEP-CTERM system histidine kinase PrsK [Rheinheimera baltica]MDP5148772.1 PEP-CTERM system histidine kinase PrsK [Rheinheimera baltica]
MTSESINLVFNVSSIGFVLATACYLFLFLLLLTDKAANRTKSLLITFAAVQVLWAVFYLLVNTQPFINIDSIVAESIRHMSVLLLLLSCLSNNNKLWRPLLSQTTVKLLVPGLLAWIIINAVFPLSSNVTFSVNLLLCIGQLALLEALYRQAGQYVWQFKPLVLGFGVLILYDFILLAEAALFSRIDPQLWAARGYIAALSLPLLVLAIRRIRAWAINVYVSRDIVVNSTIVLLAGIYLSVLALAGFSIKLFDLSWSGLLQAVFIAAGFMLLALIALSGKVRRKFKVYIEKNFYANKFDYRTKWLSLTQYLKSLKLQQDIDYSAYLTAWLNATGYQRGALIRTFSPEQLQPLAWVNRVAVTQDELNLLEHYCQSFVKTGWITDLSDPDDAFVQFKGPTRKMDGHLIIPIYDEQQLWGLCMLNTPNAERLTLNWELRDYLTIITEQIGSYLLLTQASKALSENAQFAAFNRMSAFVLHDLKNVKAQLDLLLSNSKKHIDNPEFIRDSFDTLAAMQHRLSNMLSQLTDKRHDNSSSSRFSVADELAQVIQQKCAIRAPVPSLDIIRNCELSLDRERFSSVMYHLIDNAQFATAPSGEVSITVDIIDSCTPKLVCINIMDNGCGMSEQFIQQRLFKPFDTTKGNSGMGIGAYDALQFAQQHKGQLLVQSTEGQGSCFTLKLPLATA